MERLTSVAQNRKHFLTVRTALVSFLVDGKKKSQTGESADYFPSPQDWPSVPNIPTSM